MHYPQRPLDHVKETESYKIFDSVMPQNWIVREITERDYGIDCYVEICHGTDMIGHLLTVQLKATDRPNFVKSGQYLSFYDVNPSSFNYWYNLPTPMLFVCVDLPTQTCYFSNIREYVRKNYADFKKEELKMIKIPTTDILTALTSGRQIETIYDLEMDRIHIEKIIIDFTRRIEHRCDLMRNYYGYDSFLTIDGEDKYELLSMIKDVKILSKYFNQRILFKFDEECPLYRNSDFKVSELVSITNPLLNALTSISKKLIDVMKNDECQYWQNENPALYWDVVFNDVFSSIPSINDF